LNINHVYPPPAGFHKPLIKFSRTAEDEAVLDCAGPVSFEMDGDADNSHIAEMTEQAQYATLFAGRLCEAVLRAGNDINAAHECILACFSDNPDQVHTIALDWATPDMSDLTGEVVKQEEAELDPAIERAIKQIRHNFQKSAVALPVINMWINMGFQIGLEREAVLDAGTSILNLQGAFGSIICTCRYCEEENARHENDAR